MKDSKNPFAVTMADNVPDNMYALDDVNTRRAIWHRQAQDLPEDAQHNILTAFKSAGLLEHPTEKIQRPNAKDFQLLMDGKISIEQVRMSPTYGLSINGLDVGNATAEYFPIQNERVAQFLHSVMGKEYTVHSVLSFKGGAVIAANVKVGSFDVVKGDEQRFYAQVVTSHNGQITLMLFASLIQMVCYNTLRKAMRSAQGKFSVSHTVNAELKMKTSENILQLADMEMKDYQEKLRFLASVQMTPEKFKEFMFTVIGKEREKNDKNIESRQTFQGLFDSTGERSGILPAASGSYYAALCALTAYKDFYDESSRGLKKASLTERQDKRAQSALFGKFANDKANGLDLLLDMAQKAR